jgi:polyhydroxybutyrate depolymerase
MKLLLTLLLLILVTACSHPQKIIGEGDINSSTGTNDCTLEEQPCANYVAGDYKVSYTALPRPGWNFSEWIGCADQFPGCSFDIASSAVGQFWGQTMPPLTAVFTQSSSASCEGFSTESGQFPERTLFSGGMDRYYSLKVPTVTDPLQPLPLVFDFHGFGLNKEQQAGYSQFGALVEEEQFILVTPDGIDNSWNGGTCCGNAVNATVDDVAFVNDMITEVSQEYCVDSNRIYSAGMSNGGFISYRLACELSDKIAAIAPVAAANVTTSCAPSRPVPVIAFNGTADILVNYSIALSTVDEWALQNQCESQPRIVYEQGDVTCFAYEECSQGATTQLCIIDEGGHSWPGGVDLLAIAPEIYFWAGKTTQNIDATQQAWAFFKAHPMTD